MDSYSLGLTPSASSAPYAPFAPSAPSVGISSSGRFKGKSIMVDVIDSQLHYLQHNWMDSGTPW